MFIEKDEILYKVVSWILDAWVVNNSVLDNTPAWIAGDLVVTVVDAALLALAGILDSLSVVSLAIALTHVLAIRSDTGGLIPTENKCQKLLEKV